MSRREYCSLALLLITLFGVPLCALSQDNDCAKGQSTALQAECADRQLIAAEAEMKLAFDHALETYLPTLEEKKDTQMLPKFDREQQTKWEKQMLRDLKKSQIIWLAYRESACGAVRTMYSTGTIAVVAVPLCKAEITDTRTKFLRDYFGDQR